MRTPNRPTEERPPGSSEQGRANGLLAFESEIFHGKGKDFRGDSEQFRVRWYPRTVLAHPSLSLLEYVIYTLFLMKDL